jgi:hypothetical protein
VRRALDAGHAAAQILPANVGQNVQQTDELRIAFDGDAVLFSDEAERVYKKDGLDAFTASEVDAAKEPLSGGPFKNFLAALHRIQSEYPVDEAPLRTALVTARSAPAHERVVRTLRAWGIRIDEALFLGGLDKGPFLKAFGAISSTTSTATSSRRARSTSAGTRRRRGERVSDMKSTEVDLGSAAGCLLADRRGARSAATFDPNQYKPQIVDW